MLMSPAHYAAPMDRQTLHRAAIEFYPQHGSKVDILDATDIDIGHRLAGGDTVFGEGMDAAGLK